MFPMYIILATTNLKKKCIFSQKNRNHERKKIELRPGDRYLKQIFLPCSLVYKNLQ